MALKILRTNNRGIATLYHRILKIEFSEKAKVTVASYTDEQYRKSEKTAQENLATRDSAYEQLNAEMAKPEEDRNTELIKSLTEQINSLVFQQNQSTDNIVETGTYEFDFDKTAEQSYSAYYEKLKLLPDFASAEDI